MKSVRHAGWLFIFISAISWAQSNPQPLVYPSLSPVATIPGGPGFSLAVGGYGFVAGAVVQWNGFPRTTTFISSSSLQAAISAADTATAGTALITVLNPAPGGGTSNAVYFQITNPEATVSVALESAPTTPEGAGGIAVGDFNGDGILDIVAGVSLSNGSDILFFQGKGDGTYEAPVTSHSSLADLAITVGDFNGDGKPDLLASGYIEPDIYSAVYLNNGDGTFSQQQIFGEGDYGSPAAQGDFNGDGKLDLIALDCSQGTCSLYFLEGNGKGDFPTAHPIHGFDPFNGSGSVVAGDFNGDGKLDFAVTGDEVNQIQIFPGNGDGTFLPPIFIPNVSGNYLAAADLNGDGKLDLVTDGVCTLLGNGDFTFRIHCAIGNYQSPLVLGDFNGDGKLDLAVNSIGGYPSIGQIEVLFGNGDGTFQSPVVTGANTSLAVAADFNNDGKLDFGNGGVTGVLQYLQSPASLAPLSLSYTTQEAGTTSPAQIVTLTNSGLNVLHIASVSLGGVNASEFSAASQCGSSVAAGASCTIKVVFKPTSFGLQYATLNVTYAGKTSQLVELAGNGETTNASFSPTSLNFGDQIVGTTSAPMTATLTNNGPGTLTISGFTLSGAFNTFSNNCGSTLAVNASCQYSVTFSPFAASGFSETLAANTNAQNGPISVTLSGTGTYLLVSPLSINFGSQAVGTSSAPATVTLTNESSSQIVNIGSIVETGQNKDFPETTTCTKTILPGASCTITVTFTPTAKGARSASLPIDQGSDGTQTVVLSGTGT